MKSVVGVRMTDVRKGTRKRLALLKRFEGRCFYCDRGMSLPGSRFPHYTRITREHLTPLSHGGRKGGPNVVAACYGCNQTRKTRPWWEFLQIMRARPDVFEQTVCTQVALFWPPIQAVAYNESDRDIPLVALVARWARSEQPRRARGLSSAPNP